MSTLTFNGVSSDTLGLIVESADNLKKPARDVSAVTVAGRDGELLIDNGRYLNYPVTYNVALKMTSTLYPTLQAVKEWLCAPGYKELTDSYDSTHFWLAYCSNQIEFENIFRKSARGTIEFSAKPYRYLVSGKTQINATAEQITARSITLTNPETISSKPLIWISASGSVTLSINSKSYLISKPGAWSAWIDCDLMVAYQSTLNMIPYLGFDEFPEIVPGASLLTWVGSVTELKIIPRWRCL